MALNFDNSTTSTATGTSITLTNFAVGANNPFLVVAVANWANATDIITGVTFNGVSMTKNSTMSGLIENGNSPEGYLTVFTLTGQSGTHDIVISSSGGGVTASSGITVASYNGVDQSNPINVAGRTANPTNSTSNQVSLSVSTANCWGISILCDGAGSGESVVAPYYIRLSPRTYINYADSTGIISTGTVNATWSMTSTQSTAVAFAIAPAISATNSNFFAFM